MPTLYMYRGLPGSGKTTKALAEVAKSGGSLKRVNKDDLRAMLDNKAHSKANESFVLKVRDEIIHKALAEGYSIIVDDTNFAPYHQEVLKNAANFHGVAFEIVDFNTPLEECITRDAGRPKPVGEKVIRGIWEKNLKPKAPGRKKERLVLPEAPLDDPTLPYAIICDIDGTVAEVNGRSHFDWARVGEDIPREPVINMLRSLLHTDPKLELIFVSGRDGVCWVDTYNWIENNIQVQSFQLYMRSEGDMRRDSVVKREIFDTHIRGKYNVRFIVDDRPQVIRECWQALGYGDRVFNVGTGEEF